MTEKELFTMVGIRPEPAPLKKKVNRLEGFPWISVVLMGAIVLCCLFAEVLMTKDPSYLDLKNFNVAPNAEFLFGTDTLGRDIFSGIWYGGRISITIGFLATLISTFIAVVYGSVSGIAPAWLDTLMMRFTEIFLSVPGLLLVLFFAGNPGRSQCVDPVHRHRCDQLGKYRQGHPHRSPADPQQRVCGGIEIHGWQILPYSGQAPGT